MTQIPDPLDIFWDDILSGQPERILAAFSDLNPSARSAVLAHLKRMATEPGWQPAQQLNASKALRVLAEP